MVRLTESLRRARAAATDVEVWCVTRFDRDDRTLEIYWSEPNQPYFTTSASANSQGIYRPVGGHAELQMIRDFATVVASYGRQPGSVEIFLNRSPCGSSPATQVGGQHYPIGCGNKLIQLVRQYPAIGEWILVYDEVFRGGPNNNAAIAQAHAMLHLLNAEPRVHARRFNPFLDH